MIAASGFDMAAGGALARAADVPLAILLGGSLGSVPTYNNNGLWLQPPEMVAEDAAALCDEGGIRRPQATVGARAPE